VPELNTCTTGCWTKHECALLCRRHGSEGKKGIAAPHPFADCTARRAPCNSRNKAGKLQSMFLCPSKLQPAGVASVGGFEVSVSGVSVALLRKRYWRPITEDGHETHQ